MIKCPSCGKAISEYAIVCPNCGADLKGKETIVKTEKAITIQKQDRKKKQTNFIINIALLLFVGLLTLFLHMRIFCMGLSANVFDFAVYFLVVVYSVFNIIRYRLFSGKSKTDIIIVAAAGALIFALAAYLYKPISFALYGGTPSDDIILYAVTLNKWFKIVSVFFGLVWACFTIESICFIKDRKNEKRQQDF